MILLDSNIVIYLRDPDLGPQIAEKLAGHRIGTCNAVIAEVVGYGGLTNQDSEYFENFLASMKNYPFDDSVTRKVIGLRRSMNIQLPDAIIAATALENGLTLWTHNNEGFSRVPALKLFDPLDYA